MIRKMILMMLVLLLVFSSIIMAGVNQEPGKPDMKRTFKIQGDGPGYDLLRMLADDVVQICESYQHFMEVSDKWIARAKKAKNNGHIDDVFFERYKRLAIVLKLISIPDKQGILTDLIIEEINKFGVDPLEKNFEFRGLGSVAGKLTEEILSLKAYLDKKK